LTLTHLPAIEYRRMRWRNQLGWTREIAREGGDADRDLWRVSIAEIDHDSAYSHFPGVRREQILLSGNGMRLRFADGRTHDLLPPHGRIAFDGSEAPDCELLDGPVRDFNLFYDPSCVAATLQHRPLVGSLLIFAEPASAWLVYLLAGSMRAQSESRWLTVDQGDSLRLDNPSAQRQRLILEGGGELLLLSICARGGHTES